MFAYAKCLSNFMTSRIVQRSHIFSGTTHKPTVSPDGETLTPFSPSPALPSHSLLPQTQTCLKQSYIYYIILCINSYMCVFCFHMYLCTTFMPGVHRGMNRSLDPLGLEL